MHTETESKYQLAHSAHVLFVVCKKKTVVRIEWSSGRYGTAAIQVQKYETKPSHRKIISFWKNGSGNRETKSHVWVFPHISWNLSICLAYTTYTKYYHKKGHKKLKGWSDRALNPLKASFFRHLCCFYCYISKELYVLYETTVKKCGSYCH